MHILVTKKYLIYKNYKVKCAIGKRGIGIKRKEGDLITPKGQYKIKFILYRNDRVKKIQTKIKKIVIKKNMGWCNDPKNRFYNSLIKIRKKVKHEKMYRKDRKYDLVIVIDYNLKKPIPFKGSAIFIHLTQNYKPTAGCIALSKNDMLVLLKIINKKTKINIC